MHKDYVDRAYFDIAYARAVEHTTKFANDILNASSNSDNVCMFMTDQLCAVAGGGGGGGVITYTVQDLFLPGPPGANDYSLTF